MGDYDELKGHDPAAEEAIADKSAKKEKAAVEPEPEPEPKSSKSGS